MSQPPAGPPQFTAPAGYGSYGGEQQHYPVAGAHPQLGYPHPPTRQHWYGQPSDPQPTQPGPPLARQPKQPATVVIAATLAVTASVQWICVLGFIWLAAITVAGQLGTSGADGVLLHMMSRFGYRMLDGLAWPLFSIPLAATVFGFALLGGRPWSRISFTLTGVVAVCWLAWWLQGNLLLWVFPAAYIALTCVLVWTPAGNRWYGRTAAVPG